ncbi:unnamed protein product [Trichogramma brassicae]|uniref:Ig-like domain-containing protein n=1 Tax=Trichogramma brassicae TaxID=86971 RepID=A0A6H5I4U3_9HYME|nr:unnamed protein product [Trichogramma brassicae]
MAGVVHCYIKANPPLQYVTWTKDKRLLEPYQIKDIVVMTNGSLLFTRVNENHQGKYTCTPYNAHGTQGSSVMMEVLVRNPPVFTIEPQAMYQRKVSETVEMHCDAHEAEGTQKPSITWQRVRTLRSRTVRPAADCEVIQSHLTTEHDILNLIRQKDGEALPRTRAKLVGGNLTIEGLRRQDFGAYQCVVANEVATLVKSTQLIVEGTQPHAPHNVTATADEFSVTLSWLPGYSGGPDYKQDYTIWDYVKLHRAHQEGPYREEGVQEWKTIPVTPSGSTTVTISRLKSGTNHEFQVIGKNALGEGMFSKMISVKTLDVGLQKVPTPSSSSGIQPPAVAAADQSGVKNLVGGRTYYFLVFANSTDAAGVSDQIKYSVPARVKHKAITAGVCESKPPMRPRHSLPNLVDKHKRMRRVSVDADPWQLVESATTTTTTTSSSNTSYASNPRQHCHLGDDARSATSAGTPVESSNSNNNDNKNNNLYEKIPRKSRIPGLKLLQELLSPDSPDIVRRIRPLGKISRAADGRFVIADSVMSSMNNSILDASSSDDGGFLSMKQQQQQQHLKSSWRRPLVDTSHLSLRSEGSGLSIAPQSLPIQKHHQLMDQINTHQLDCQMPLSLPIPMVPDSAICTISSTHFLASSPSCQTEPRSTNIWNSPMYTSDLSSVKPQNSTATERSASAAFPSQPSYLQLRSIHQRYSQELPSLKAIHAEAQRFVPVQPLATSSPPQGTGRPRARLPPRHARHARSAPELAASPDLETSPESRSSSSGFGSKNTSQIQNQSSRSGSTVAEWRPPPYRPPPPPLSVGRWLELQDPHLHHSLGLSKSQQYNLNNVAAANVDAGSVDGHYEFDPVSCTPTPTSASTPTREERPPVHQMHHHQLPQIHQVHTTSQQTHSQLPISSSRYSRDNIEARVQAMKAEFHQFRQRQAKRRCSAHLESAC